MVMAHFKGIHLEGLRKTTKTSVRIADECWLWWHINVHILMLWSQGLFWSVAMAFIWSDLRQSTTWYLTCWNVQCDNMPTIWVKTGRYQFRTQIKYILSEFDGNTMTVFIAMINENAILNAQYHQLIRELYG